METEDEAIKRCRIELILEGCVDGRTAPDEWIKHVQANKETLEQLEFIFDGERTEYKRTYKGQLIILRLKDVLLDTMDINYLIYDAQDRIDKGKDPITEQWANLLREELSKDY